MLYQFANAKLAVEIQNKNQWNELKKYCSSNSIGLVNYGEKEFEFPVFCLIVGVQATERTILCPTHDNTEEITNRGYEAISFKKFKNLA